MDTAKQEKGDITLQLLIKIMNTSKVLGSRAVNGLGSLSIWQIMFKSDYISMDINGSLKNASDYVQIKVKKSEFDSNPNVS